MGRRKSLPKMKIINKKKTYKSVHDMLVGLKVDKKFIKKFDDAIKRKPKSIEGNCSPYNKKKDLCKNCPTYKRMKTTYVN